MKQVLGYPNRFRTEIIWDNMTAFYNSTEVRWNDVVCIGTYQNLSAYVKKLDFYSKIVKRFHIVIDTHNHDYIFVKVYWLIKCRWNLYTGFLRAIRWCPTVEDLPLHLDASKQTSILRMVELLHNGQKRHKLLAPRHNFPIDKESLILILLKQNKAFLLAKDLLTARNKWLSYIYIIASYG